MAPNLRLVYCDLDVLVKQQFDTLTNCLSYNNINNFLCRH